MFEFLSRGLHTIISPSASLIDFYDATIVDR